MKKLEKAKIERAERIENAKTRVYVALSFIAIVIIVGIILFMISAVSTAYTNAGKYADACEIAEKRNLMKGRAVKDENDVTNELIYVQVDDEHTDKKWIANPWTAGLTGECK